MTIEKHIVLDKIRQDEYGPFSEPEVELIYQINEMVMSEDGTAEGWGGYSYNPLDYLYTSIDIFKLTKQFFDEK